jgi:hypothetical protein
MVIHLTSVKDKTKAGTSQDSMPNVHNQTCCHISKGMEHIRDTSFDKTEPNIRLTIPASSVQPLKQSTNPTILAMKRDSVFWDITLCCPLKVN